MKPWVVMANIRTKNKGLLGLQISEKTLQKQLLYSPLSFDEKLALLIGITPLE